MTYPSHNDFVRQRMDDYFAREMTRKYFEDIENSNREKARNAENRKYYSSTSSSKQSPDTPASLAVEKRCAERRERLYRSINASSSVSFVKLIKSCCPWR